MTRAEIADRLDCIREDHDLTDDEAYAVDVAIGYLREAGALDERARIRASVIALYESDEEYIDRAKVLAAIDGRLLI